MTSTSNERGSIAMVIVIIGMIIAIIGIAYWVIINNKGSSSASTDTVAANCGNLALSKGSPDGTAGTIYWHATITNNGDHACRLTGYPGAFMTDSSTLSVGATDNSLYAPETVTLNAHGGQAHVVIGLPEPGNFDPGVPCTDKNSSTLQLFLPGLATPIATNFGESACQSYTVTAIQPGA